MNSNDSNIKIFGYTFIFDMYYMHFMFPHLIKRSEKTFTMFLIGIFISYIYIASSCINVMCAAHMFLHIMGSAKGFVTIVTFMILLSFMHISEKEKTI